MHQISNIDHAFNQYLESHNADHHTMRQCWRAAVQWMAQDILDTLGDYATACEGLPAQRMTHSQKYDDARENLSVYINQLLEEIK